MLVLAHELVHAMFNVDDPDVVYYFENPLRRRFGVEPRRGYKRVPFILPIHGRETHARALVAHHYQR